MSKKHELFFHETMDFTLKTAGKYDKLVALKRFDLSTQENSRDAVRETAQLAGSRQRER